MSVNKAILIGRLGANPEFRETDSGRSVCNFQIATNRRWTDEDGEKQEATEWHRIAVFGRQAETCTEYLGTGSRVYIEGRLRTQQWEDEDGNTRYSTNIVAGRVQFLDSPEGSAESADESDDIPF